LTKHSCNLTPFDELFYIPVFLTASPVVEGLVEVEAHHPEPNTNNGNPNNSYFFHKLWRHGGARGRNFEHRLPLGGHCI